MGREVKRGVMGAGPRFTLCVMISSCVLFPLPQAVNGVAPNMIRGTGSDNPTDPAYFMGPADPEKEALARQWGDEETFVVLPRLQSLGGDVPWVEQISWAPRAQVYHNFLTPEECSHLIELARPKMAVASVVDKKTGVSKSSEVRTSTGHFLQRGQDAIVTRIEERISAFSMIPVDHGEGIQILNYQPGQKYDPHFDYFQDQENIKHGGQRVATVLLYLSDVEAGGETVFPRGEFVDPGYKASEQLVRDSEESHTGRTAHVTSKCASGKLHVAPKAGTALLFWSVDPMGNDDGKSLHGGCAVEAGEKWTATKWMRHGPYGAEREMKEKLRIKRGHDKEKGGGQQGKDTAGDATGGHDEN